MSEAWQQFEDLVKETMPELMAEFEASPSAEPAKPQSVPGGYVCLRCGAMVPCGTTQGWTQLHRRWHRAISLDSFVKSSHHRDIQQRLASTAKEITELIDGLIETLGEEANDAPADPSAT